MTEKLNEDKNALAITGQDIKNLFCPLATEKELKISLGIVKSLGLNPFTHEVHFVKYKADQPLEIIVGYEVYLKRAERTGKLDGWKAGISEDKKTAFVDIYRKDWKIPFHWEVILSEFDKGQATWKSIPTFMGLKVAIAQGFRLAFPDELGGMPYTQEEHEAYDIKSEEIKTKPEVSMPEAIDVQPEPEPQKVDNEYELLLKDFGKAKAKVGEKMYYEVLGRFGYEHANECRKIDEGRKIIKAMKDRYELLEKSQ